MNTYTEPTAGDRWIVAGGGMETPFLYGGVRYLYVWNPARKQHGYLHMDTDTVYTDYREGHRTHV